MSKSIETIEGIGPKTGASLRKAVQPLDPRGDLPAPAEAGTAGTSAKKRTSKAGAKKR